MTRDEEIPRKFLFRSDIAVPKKTDDGGSSSEGRKAKLTYPSVSLLNFKKQSWTWSEVQDFQNY